MSREIVRIRRTVRIINVLTNRSLLYSHKCDSHCTGLWEDIRYDTDDQNGANVRAAVKKARSILDAGRLNRPEVTSQSLWLVTDAEYGTEEFLLWTSYVKDDSTS